MNAASGRSCCCLQLQHKQLTKFRFQIKRLQLQATATPICRTH